MTDEEADSRAINAQPREPLPRLRRSRHQAGKPRRTSGGLKTGEWFTPSGLETSASRRARLSRAAVQRRFGVRRSGV
jgi:hypothetical protein